MKHSITLILLLLLFQRAHLAIGGQVVATVPNDPLYNSQWGLRKIMAPEAWAIQKGNSSIIVAVVDTGVDYNHPDLKSNMWTASDGTHGWDFVDNDNDPMDTHGHGTQVAGVIGAVSDNGIGVCGVAWNVKIMSVRVRATLSTDYVKVAQGIRYAADQGAKIINLSLGGLSVPSWVLKDAIDYAYSKGVLLVGAAGNQNTNQPHWPDAYENVMAIAGTDLDDKKAEGSNFGIRIDVCAPFYAITTGLNGTYIHGGGTSYSAPFVSGLAALILSRYPTLTNGQARELIKLTADKIDYINPNYDGMLGSGRINAYRALTETVSISITTMITQSKTTYRSTVTTVVPEFADTMLITTLTFILAWAILRTKKHSKSCALDGAA